MDQLLELLREDLSCSVQWVESLEGAAGFEGVFDLDDMRKSIMFIYVYICLYMFIFFSFVVLLVPWFASFLYHSFDIRIDIVSD